MCAPIVDGRHLDVHMVTAPVDLLVLDAQVGEVDLLVEVRQVAFERPFFNLLSIAIWVAVVVVTLAVALV